MKNILENFEFQILWKLTSFLFSFVWAILLFIREITTGIYEILSLQILSHFITNFRRFKFIISLLNFTLLF